MHALGGALAHALGGVFTHPLGSAEMGINMKLRVMPEEQQPFAGMYDICSHWRIPSILTLSDGTVLAAADCRWAHGQDSPGNLETVVSRSEDGGQTWKAGFVNHFEDLEDGSERMGKSASFIDPSMAQDSEGTVYLITDVCPAYLGCFESKNGSTGYGTKGLILTEQSTVDAAESDDPSRYSYEIGAFCETVTAGGESRPAARVECREGFETDGKWKGYLVDAEYYLYTPEGQPVYVKQFDREGQFSEKEVACNVFFAQSPLKVYPTNYLGLRKSTDSGRTWSHLEILKVKNPGEAALLIGPGRGVCIPEGKYKDRLVFPVYEFASGSSQASVIYKEPGEKIWHRGQRTVCDTIWAGESQLICRPDDVLRLYCRNGGGLISYYDSTDGGETWGQCSEDPALTYASNCMISFIQKGEEIFASYPKVDWRNTGEVIRGRIGADGRMEIRDRIQLQEGRFFAYSCLTMLDDRTLGYLYEDEPYHITYAQIDLD